MKSIMNNGAGLAAGGRSSGSGGKRSSNPFLSKSPNLTL